MLPYYLTNRAQKSIKFQGAKLWNSLPNFLNIFPIVLKNTTDGHFKLKIRSLLRYYTLRMFALQSLQEEFSLIHFS